MSAEKIIPPAPRITEADIQSQIQFVHYFTAHEGVVGSQAFQDSGKCPSEIGGSESLQLLTFCVLVLRNGFTVTGESACASPENFDPEIGKRIALDYAIEKCWPLLGYELKGKLHASGRGG